MKQLLSILAASAALAQGAMAFDLNFTGSFTTGDLAGEAIAGFVDIDENGNSFGTAFVGAPLFPEDGELLDLNFSFGTVSFDLNDDPLASATFDNGTLVGLDYAGFNLDGEELNVFYDGFAEDAASAISVFFDDGFGNVSTGTLNLPTAVPEPSTYAIIFGTLALGFVAMRKRSA